MNLRVKVCGVTRPEDAELAVALGARHLGCVLAADSPRRADERAVREIAAAVTGIDLVLVHRGATVAQVCDASARLELARVQVHGVDEAFCDALEAAGLVPTRVHSIAADATALPPLSPAPTPAKPALIDVGRGGSGRAFGWRLLGDRGPDATFVAGGIRPDNVAALLAHRPWGIDVSSGIERAPGVKDHDALRRLFEQFEV